MNHLVNDFFDDARPRRREAPPPPVADVNKLHPKLRNNINLIAAGAFGNANSGTVSKITNVKTWAVTGLIGGFILAIVLKKNTLMYGSLGAVAAGSLGYIINKNSPYESINS